MLFQNLKTKLVMVLALFASGYSSASVVINNTRVIFPGSENEVTVQLSNAGKKPVLVQSWIDTGDDSAKPESIKVPFVLTPPVNRLDPNKGQTLRIRSIDSSALPSDKESVFWLNVLEIPSISEETQPNRLQIALRNRIKIFYRPQQINNADQVTSAAENLQWKIEHKKLVAINTSPYFVSLASIKLNDGSKSNYIDGEMISPRSQKEFFIDTKTSVQSIDYEYINDWGALKSKNFSFN